MVTTNWRADPVLYTETRARAAEMGMSVNAYVNYVMESFHRSSSFGMKPRVASQKKSSPERTGYEAMWKILSEAKKIKNKPKGASKEDKIIYGL